MPVRHLQLGALRGVRRICVIGTGLLGGSLGLGLREAGFDGAIVGLGRSPETLRRARERRCIDEIATDLPAAVRNCQLVVLASPVRSFERWLGELRPLLRPEMIVTDVGSTKGWVCEAAARLLGEGRSRFVGSHPMAGGERTGPGHARADLFSGKPCIVTPGESAAPDALAAVESLWATLGMQVIRMTPAEHDAAVARISHLPHAVAVCLVELAARLGGLDLASSGFRDTTRVASGDPALWLDIFTSNRAAVAEAIDTLARQLGEFRDAVLDEDEARLFELLRHAKDARDAWLASRPALRSEESGE